SIIVTWLFLEGRGRPSYIVKLCTPVSGIRMARRDWSGDDRPAYCGETIRGADHGCQRQAGTDQAHRGDGRVAPLAAGSGGRGAHAAGVGRGRSVTRGT